MARYLGPRLRVVRRFGNLPGLTAKVPKKKHHRANMAQIKKNNKSHHQFQITKFVCLKNKNFAIIMD
jgi:hypothetical protein